MSGQKNKGLLKDGTSRLAKAGDRRGIPPILWVAAVVCAVGGYLLFRQPGGGDAPTGIGERRSVVTVGADSVAAGGHDAPRSGEVDIGDETRELVAEAPVGGAAPQETVAREAVAQEQEEAAPPPPAPAPRETQAKPAPAEEKVVPAASGPWVVQVGSFGSPENADREAARLREAGWDARVKVGNTSDGSMIYRVRIGYFASRDLAQTFARQNKDRIPGAISVHR